MASDSERQGQPAERRYSKVGVFYSDIARLPRLRQFLGCDQVALRPSDRDARALDAVAGWGHKPTAKRAREYASRHGIPYLALEDGFVRSVGLGGESPPLSLVVDERGIYYDAATPSALELILSSVADDDVLSSPGLLERAAQCRVHIVANQLSKYNHTPAPEPVLRELNERLGKAAPGSRGSDPASFVLVVDQTFDDAAVNLGLGSEGSFRQMVEAALDENPGQPIVIKTHPDTLAGKKKGYLTRNRWPKRVLILAEDINPQALLVQALKVYCCTSQLGFEALLARKEVVCFGVPFFAGWGLTDDRIRVPRRGMPRTLDQLVAAALLLYPRYVDPLGGQRCSAEQVIQHVALQRRISAQNQRRFLCFGFTPWKRPFVRRYLGAPGGSVEFVPTVASAAKLDLGKGATFVTWASRAPEGLAELAMQREVELWRMEDGFLRSVGLGSDGTAPGSLVLDKRGIYYDPRTPSDLEHTLQNAEFSDQELVQAAALRSEILRAKISKYNPHPDVALKLENGGRRVIFVPGQVEGDASVRLGSAKVNSNALLLQAARASNPEAFIVYKPHPDVMSGNRAGEVVPAGRQVWDQLVSDVPIDECLALADEVHTMTSLVGFEALLRELTVVTYGQPFYAGWGLTVDHAEMPRRTRRLTLDQLVAGTLLRYPRYYSFQAHAFCTASEMVQELASRKHSPREKISGSSALGRRVRNLAVSAAEWFRSR